MGDNTREDAMKLVSTVISYTSIWRKKIRKNVKEKESNSEIKNRFLENVFSVLNIDMEGKIIRSFLKNQMKLNSHWMMINTIVFCTIIKDKSKQVKRKKKKSTFANQVKHKIFIQPYYL